VGRVKYQKKREESYKLLHVGVIFFLALDAVVKFFASIEIDPWAGWR